MQRRIRRGKTPSLFLDAVSTGLATWTTLAVRVPQLMAGTMRPVEITRMISEKITATAEGALQAGVAAQRIAVRRRKPPTAAGLVNDMLAIGEAATRPARKTVKANARRLSRS